MIASEEINAVMVQLQTPGHRKDCGCGSCRIVISGVAPVKQICRRCINWKRTGAVLGICWIANDGAGKPTMQVSTCESFAPKALHVEQIEVRA